MADMTAWDGAILLIAAYCAVMFLVRLMRTRRDAIVAQLQGEVTAQLNRKRAEKRREQSRSGRAKPAPPAARGTKR